MNLVSSFKFTRKPDLSRQVLHRTMLCLVKKCDAMA